MLNQSYSHVFVTNTPKLLASGTTVDLKTGQIGIFDGNTYQAVTAPTYAKNKALILAQGRPNQPWLALMAGIASDSYKTKLIKGKRITEFTGKKPSRGHQEAITVGFDGSDITKTLTGISGNVETFYLKLTGLPVSKLYSTQGIIRQYKIDAGCAVGCEDGECDAVPAEKLADLLVEKINSDAKINMFVKASKLVYYPTATPSVTKVSYKRFQVTIPDDGSVAAETAVGVQYPGVVSVKRVSRDGIYSTYELVNIGSAANPTAVSIVPSPVIPQCTTCPSGFSLTQSGFATLITRQDAGANVSSTVLSDYSALKVYKIGSNFGEGKYIVVKATAITAPVSNDVIISTDQLVSACVATGSTTYAWAQVGLLYKYAKKQRLTLADDCQSNRLVELQNAFPNSSVTLVSGTPAGACQHTYEATVYSNLVSEDCSVAQATFTYNESFDGVYWEDLAVDNTVADAVAGVKIEGIFQEFLPNEVLSDYYAVEYDGVHIQGSFYNPDYNASPCQDVWPVTKISNFTYPHGDGYMVRKDEIRSLSYTLQEIPRDWGVRHAEGYHLNTDLTKYYDEYTLAFEFDYFTLGWSQKYTDTYRIKVYVPEGTGKEFETAINNYIASANIDIDPVVLYSDVS